MSYCAYGELVKPDVSNIVLYCDLDRRAKEDPGAREAPGAQRP